MRNELVNIGAVSSERFGDNLKGILAERQMSQKELANKSGVDEHAIGRYASGKHFPKLDTACLIAGALEVSLDKLVK